MSERQPDNPSTRSAGQTEGDVKNAIDNKKLCHPKYACGELVESVEGSSESLVRRYPNRASRKAGDSELGTMDSGLPTPQPPPTNNTPPQPVRSEPEPRQLMPVVVQVNEA